MMDDFLDGKIEKGWTIERKKKEIIASGKSSQKQGGLTSFLSSFSSHVMRLSEIVGVTHHV